MIQFELTRRTLHFRKPARTSRGAYTEHEMIVLTLHDGGHTGVGECAPLPDLSCDRGAYSDLDAVRLLVSKALADEDMTLLRPYPALLFAVESALAGLRRSPLLYDTPFARGEVGIPINGLVWMAGYDEMLAQMESKINDGYRCVKLKIGAIAWEDEMRLIRLLRSRFSADELELRVDANGAFSPEDAISRLEELSKYGIHSIEQPLRQGQWDAMAELCRNSPVPIALDEELIGVNDPERKCQLLDSVRPQYIVLKPTLHGGMSGTWEWVELSRKRGVKSWITSALESNIGLANVALLAASIYGITPCTLAGTMPQGLGTGLLFTDNIDTGVYIRNGHIWFSGRME